MAYLGFQNNFRGGGSRRSSVTCDFEGGVVGVVRNSVTSRGGGVVGVVL